MAVSVDVPVDGQCPMAPFVYINTSILSTQAVVDNERESSCKCYGQDCSLDPGACECMQKNGGECPYNKNGLLQGVDGSVRDEVPFFYLPHFCCFDLHFQHECVKELHLAFFFL